MKSPTVQSREKYPNAREALKALVAAIIPLYRASSIGQNTDPYIEILKDVPTRTGKPASITTLRGVYNGRSPNFIKIIAQNISEGLAKRKQTDVLYQELLWKIFEEVDPEYCPKLTKEYFRYRVSTANTVYISNNFLPYLNDYADLLGEVDDLKIVIMAPDSAFLPDRASQIGDKVQKMHNTIADNLTLLMENNIPLEAVKLHKGMPRNPFYIFDDDIFCGFYLEGDIALKCPFRKFNAETTDGKKLIEEYDRIWATSKPASYDLRTPVAVHKDIQMLSILFPSLKEEASGKVVRQLGDQIAGVYRFSRFRRSYYRDQSVAMPIITGLMQFFPFTEDGGLKWEAVLPDSNIEDFNKLPRIKGRIIPSKTNLYLLGETVGENIEDKHPTLAGIKRFVRTGYNWKYLTFQGFLLRQQTDDDIYASRVIFKAEQFNNLWDARHTISKNNPYINEKQFKAIYQIEPSRLKLNKEQETDRGMMRLDKHLKMDPSIL